MFRKVSYVDYSVAILNMYLAYFHFRGTVMGIVLSIAALILLWIIKQSISLDFN
jgi:Co/Zn/Cd efflux system component